MENITGGMKIKGELLTECYRWHDEDGNRFRDNKGRFERRLMWADKTHNIVTTQGLNRILDVMFAATTQITTWYCTLVETNTTPAAAMTYATPTYTESTAYTETTRPAYVEAAASAGSMTNSANKAVFTINATKTMYGASLVGGGTAPTTKGDAAGGGALYCYALFSASRAVVADDVINLTYTVTSADDGV